MLTGLLMCRPLLGITWSMDDDRNPSNTSLLTESSSTCFTVSNPRKNWPHCDFLAGAYPVIYLEVTYLCLVRYQQVLTVHWQNTYS